MQDKCTRCIIGDVQRASLYMKVQDGGKAHLVFSRSFLVRSVACWPPLEVLWRACSSCFSLSTSSRCFCLLIPTRVSHQHAILRFPVTSTTAAPL